MDISDGTQAGWAEFCRQFNYYRLVKLTVEVLAYHHVILVHSSVVILRKIPLGSCPHDFAYRPDSRYLNLPLIPLHGKRKQLFFHVKGRKIRGK